MAQPQEIRPIVDANPKDGSPGAHTLSDLATNQGVLHPLIGFNHFLEQLTELREALYLYLPVFRKGYR